MQIVVSEKAGMATFSLAPKMNSGSSGLFRGTRYKAPTEIVSQTTLSELVNFLALKKIKLAKMNIEEFENEAIFGYPCCLSRTSSKISHWNCTRAF